MRIFFWSSWRMQPTGPCKQHRRNSRVVQRGQHFQETCVHMADGRLGTSTHGTPPLSCARSTSHLRCSLIHSRASLCSKSLQVFVSYRWMHPFAQVEEARAGQRLADAYQQPNKLNRVYVQDRRTGQIVRVRSEADLLSHM